jgi:hypothetical protein
MTDPLIILFELLVFQQLFNLSDVEPQTINKEVCTVSSIHLEAQTTTTTTRI